ncbi:MAG: GNAT family N-acetyltransferase [Aestuariibacter sp.]
MNAFTVKKVDWRESRQHLKRLRDRVFVCEWRIPRQAEFDQRDPNSEHILVVDDSGNEVATGRITPDGEIGRIAVVSKHRSNHIYDLVFEALINIAREKQFTTVYLQCDLDGIEHFVERGFKPIGSVYMDAGIPRQKMSCPVNQFNWSRVELTH